ncbi:uncharacterized protein LOC113214964 isoform X4 [Frankliniella occidentalis]|uniref:Uncharacterized protein LOC113214964 isoform X4 n=1 Tax=Frankliniella occidentalis TaxID=133901 RepID=A0A9C6X4X8_FRAOC|nr:uncharacterized protein LOC113214964 isoform X4 [Frankliniella occidentalis]
MVAPTLPATVIALVIIGAALPPVVPFRVLGLFPFQGHSHNIMSKSLMEGLADRGHEVVMLSSLPLMKPRANYTDLSLAAQLPPVINTMTYDQLANAHGFLLSALIASPTTLGCTTVSEPSTTLLICSAPTCTTLAQ